jgi:hypothetical protein
MPPSIAQAVRIAITIVVQWRFAIAFRSSRTAPAKTCAASSNESVGSVENQMRTTFGDDFGGRSISVT